MSASRYLALDIGGTKIEAGLVTEEGAVLGTPRHVRASPGCSRERLLADVDSALHRFLPAAADGLGVGFPAQGDFTRGIPCEGGARFPEMNGFPLRDHLSQRYGIPVEMNTDANMFGLGVAQFGEGQWFSSFIGLTVGTGIGVSVIVDGQLEQGHTGVPREALNALLQSSKRVYHLGANFRQLYCCDGEELAARAAGGQQQALLHFATIGTALAETIQSLVNTRYRPQAVILGGGITQSYRFFRRALDRGMRGSNVFVQPTSLPYPSLAGAAAMFARA